MHEPLRNAWKKAQEHEEPRQKRYNSGKFTQAIKV